METKKLLTAFALPALLLTGCTQDAIIESNTESTPLENRNTVDVPGVSFEFGADTRLALDGSKYVFEAEDQLGACLMDNITDSYHKPGTGWSQWFKFIDYIHTNYKFNYNVDTKRFENNALMSEGNYFFYYPYDKEMTDRNAFEQELNAEQKLEKNADGTLNPRKTILDNQIFLGHSAITGDREDHDDLAVTMNPVFAYPAFRIAYSSPQPIKVKKVAFKQVDNKNQVTNDGIVESFNTTLKVDPTNATFKQNSKQLADNATYYKMTNVTTANQISVEIPDVELAAGSTVAGYVVIPAGIYDAKNTNATAHKSLWMYVYTDRGVVRTYLNEKNPEQEPTGAPSDNVWTKAAYTDFQPSNGMLIDMGFSYEAISAPTDFTVSTTEDFELIMSWQANQSVPTTLNATVVGEDIVLSKKIYDCLKNENLTLNLKADNDATVTIPADAPANALDRINIVTENKLTVVNKATLTVRKNFQNGSDTYAPVLLQNDGSMTLTGDAYNFSNCEFKNNGTLVLENKANKNAMVLSFIGNHQLKNFGTMIIAAKTNANGTSAYGVDNYGTLTINEDVEFEGKVNNETKATDKLAVINVNGSWVNAKGENRGTIKVASKGSVVAAANEGIKNGTKRLYDNNGNLVYRASIENAGVVNGIVNGFTDQENALIVMMNKDARLITKAGSIGEINNTECSTYVTKQNGETIFCEVSGEKSATDLADLTLNSNAKRLDILNGTTITIPSGEDGKPGNITVSIEKVLVKGNLTISGAKNTLKFIGETKGADMEIVAGTTTIAAQSIVALGQTTDKRGTLSIGNGKFIISNNAKFYGKGKSNAGNKVENYGVWNE